MNGLRHLPSIDSVQPNYPSRYYRVMPGHVDQTAKHQQSRATMAGIKPIRGVRLDSNTGLARRLTLYR